MKLFMPREDERSLSGRGSGGGVILTYHKYIYIVDAVWVMARSPAMIMPSGDWRWN